MSAPKTAVKAKLEGKDGVVGISEVTGGLLVDLNGPTHHTSTFNGLLADEDWYVETIHWTDRVIRVVPCTEVMG